VSVRVALPSTEATGEMSAKLKAAVREFYDRGWNQGDLSVIDELFSPAYQDHDAAAQTGASGLDAAAGSSRCSAQRSRICMSRSKTNMRRARR
jgi:hypothetical protein